MTHWYRKDGTTAYGATLKEARENGYLPSVTTVDKVIANEGLEQWKIRQAVMSALTLERKDVRIKQYNSETETMDIVFSEYESDADYINRILTDSRQQARKAAKLGNVIHKLAERYISGKPLFFKGNRADVWRLFKPLQDWIYERQLKGEAEAVLVGDGYAGKADYIDADIIVDFKTTTITPADMKRHGQIMKRKIYDSWGRQLAALQEAQNEYLDITCFGNGEKTIIHNRPPKQCISVIISTNVDYPGVWCYYWTQAELDKHLQVFQAALKIYRIQKGL